MASAQNLARCILAKGHILAVDQGRLCLESSSEAAVPDDWFHTNYQLLVSEILEQTGIDALCYESYSTGKYGPAQAGGITLQFSRCLTHANRYAIFNAELTRSRNTNAGKAGSPLPQGQFRIGKRNQFYQFWQRTGLKTPSRLSSFHDYMGKLKGILFVAGRHDGERLDKRSIQPLTLTHQQLLTAFGLAHLPDNSQTVSRQTPDNCQTRMPDKEIALHPVEHGLQPDQTTGADNYGLRYQGSAGISGNVIAPSSPKKPIEQTTDEWRADYNSSDPLHRSPSSDD